jgi:hypothetical protein
LPFEQAIAIKEHHIMRQNPNLVLSALISLSLASCGQESTGKNGGTPAAPTATVAKSALADPCLLKPEEVAAALGYTGVVAKPYTADLEAYGMANCRYEGSNGTAQLNLTWIDPAMLAAAKADGTRGRGGTLEPIAGDADGAFLQHQENIKSGALHYWRQNILVEIRPLSWKEPKEAMKAKLLSLRRVP